MTEPNFRLSDRLAWLLSGRPWATLAWIHALGKSENTAALHMQRIFTSRHLPLPLEMPNHVSDEVRHSQLLQQCVEEDRSYWLTQNGYKSVELQMCHLHEKYLVLFFSSLMKRLSDPNMIYLYGAWGLEMRVFKHYTDIKKWTLHETVAQTISGILEDETAHTHMVHTSLSEKGLLDADILKFVRRIEDDLWERMSHKAIFVIQEFDKKIEAMELTS